MDRQRMLDRAAESLAAWNRGDAEGVVANTVDDVLWQDAALPMPLHGREAMKVAVQGYMTAFPDLHVEIRSTIVDGNRIVQEWTATGTHRGPLMGIEPTGRATSNDGATVAIYDEDGRIVAGAMYWNALSLMYQLGVLGDPAGVQHGTSA